MLLLQNFKSGIGEKEILHGVDLAIKPGEVHAVMGPNGSGKTTLVMSLMGHPNYKIKSTPFAKDSGGEQKSKVKINDVDIAALLPEERAKMGLFVSFQSPIEITGVTLLAFLRTAYKALHPDEKIPLSEFKKSVSEALRSVNLDEDFMKRSVNEGFSGGERKRAEVAQLIILKPQFAILDEIDSGLDVDSLKIVAQAIGEAVKKYHMGVLIITHYQRILHFLNPTKVHVLIDGQIRKSGTMEIVKQIEENGYAGI